MNEVSEVSKTPKKKWSKAKKIRLAVILAVVLLLCLCLGTGIFYLASAVSLGKHLSSYEYSLELLAKAMVNGDAGGMESAAIASGVELKELDKELGYKRWNLIDSFSPEFKEDRIQAADMIAKLDAFNNSTMWTIVYYAGQTSISDTIETIKAHGIDDETAVCIETYTSMLDELYDPVMELLTYFDSMKEFNISVFEDEFYDYRYPIKVAVTALPIVREACDNMADPVVETIRSTPLLMPEKVSLDTLDAATVNSLAVYAELAESLLDPAEKCLSDLQSLKDIPSPEKRDKSSSLLHNLIKSDAPEEFDFEDAFEKVFSTIDRIVPEINSYIPAVRLLFDKLVDPALEVLRAYPPSGFKVDKGYDIATIKAYLEFAGCLRADAEVITNAVYSFSSLGNKASQTVDKVAGSLEKFALVYDRAEPYLPVLDMFLVDDGQLHLFLLAAQNSAEIRASGGFPGSMGWLAADNGIFTISYFTSVWDVLTLNTPGEVYPTGVEDTLFGGWLQLPRDADFNPHFPRVAEIWECAAEKRMTVPTDAVISLTPVFVEKMMQLMDEDIVLSDGTLVTKENVVRVLEHDIYFNYFGEDARGLGAKALDDRNKITDALFAETANKVMDKMFSDLNLDKLLMLIDIIEECRADRTLMLWHEDEEKQAIIEALDFDGGLNDDPEHPQVGVYYSCATSSKLGWFLDINVDIGDAVINDDGTRSYNVTASFTNTIDGESLKASRYIIGEDGGSMRSYFHFFAPAGGTISNAQTVGGRRLPVTEYQDLEVAYLKVYYLSPGETLTFTFTVTTAPGVTEIPTVSQTPTLQNYR